MPSITDLELKFDDVAILLEAVADAIETRLDWTFRRYGAWGDLNFSTVQKVMDNYASTYARLMMFVRECKDDNSFDSELADMMALSTDQVEDLNLITVANDWDDLPLRSQ